MIHLIKTVFPKERKRRGLGLVIRYGWSDSLYGPVLTGMTERGVCWLGFAPHGDRAAGEEKMHRHFPAAVFTESKIRTPFLPGADRALILDLYGSAFQLGVWEALCAIPMGESRTYGDIAAQIGAPEASRAVGGALGANPVSVLVPCHRVLPAEGGLGNYGWGPLLKGKILESESCSIQQWKKRT